MRDWQRQSGTLDLTIVELIVSGAVKFSITVNLL